MSQSESNVIRDSEDQEHPCHAYLGLSETGLQVLYSPIIRSVQRQWRPRDDVIMLTCFPLRMDGSCLANLFVAWLALLLGRPLLQVV